MLDIIAIVLFLHGTYSLYLSFKGKDIAGYISSADIFLLRKLFGNQHKSIVNFVFGVLEIISGFIILFKMPS